MNCYGKGLGHQVLSVNGRRCHRIAPRRNQLVQRLNLPLIPLPCPPDGWLAHNKSQNLKVCDVCFMRVCRLIMDAASSTFQDGLVALKLDDWIVTSPNVTFIPQPVYGRVIVSRHGDSHYSVHDSIQ